MKKRNVILFLSIFIVFVMASVVLATPVVDQQQTVVDPSIGSTRTTGKFAQTVKQGLTGQLTAVEFPAICNEADLRVEIQRVDAFPVPNLLGIEGFVPNGLVLASLVIPEKVLAVGGLAAFGTFKTLTFPSPAFLTTETRFAVVLETLPKAGSTNAFCAYKAGTTDPNLYPDGQGLQFEVSEFAPDGRWVGGNRDFVFRTLVEQAPTGDADSDGIKDSIDTQLGVFSSAFDDRPLGGTTFGTIADRAGWTVTVTDDLANGVTVSVSGSGGNARFLSCSNNVETTLNVAGETAKITCASTTVTAQLANPTIFVREPRTGAGGRAVRVRLETDQTVTLGSLITASASNTKSIEVQVVDEFDKVLGSLQLPPAQTVDIDPEGPDGEVVVKNLGTTSLTFTMEGTPITIAPGERIADECPGSIADAILLGPNQYAQNNLQTSAFEVGPNQDQSLIYDMKTTKGCTCRQIVEVLGAGKGHLEKGCSPSLMEEFTGVSANQDRVAGVGRRALAGGAVSLSGDGVTSWLGLISVVSIVTLVVVSATLITTLSHYNGLSKRRKK